jgi:hypothetical protein
VVAANDLVPHLCETCGSHKAYIASTKDGNVHV